MGWESSTLLCYCPSKIIIMAATCKKRKFFDILWKGG